MAGKLLAVWLLALVASASSCYLIAGSARRGPPGAGPDGPADDRQGPPAGKTRDA